MWGNDAVLRIISCCAQSKDSLILILTFFHLYLAGAAGAFSTVTVSHNHHPHSSPSRKLNPYPSSHSPLEDPSFRAVPALEDPSSPTLLAELDPSSTLLPVLLDPSLLAWLPVPLRSLAGSAEPSLAVLEVSSVLELAVRGVSSAPGLAVLEVLFQEPPRPLAEPPLREFSLGLSLSFPPTSVTLTASPPPSCLSSQRW